MLNQSSYVFWTVVISIPLCITRKPMILKERRGGIRALPCPLRSVSCRFQIANITRLARIAVDHCTLLHAGGKWSFRCFRHIKLDKRIGSQDLARDPPSLVRSDAYI